MTRSQTWRTSAARRKLGLAASGVAAVALVVSGTTAAFGTGGKAAQPAAAPVTVSPQAGANVQTAAKVQTALSWNKPGTGATHGLGSRAGLLPAKKLVLKSALQVDLTRQTVRLPLYPGTSHGQKVWYVLLDSSDRGAANDLGINYAPKLANVGISNPAAVQTVTLKNPTPEQNRFGPAVLDFPGAPTSAPPGGARAADGHLLPACSRPPGSRHRR